jgi:hypothetical protein
MPMTIQIKIKLVMIADMLTATVKSFSVKQIIV